MIAVGMRMRVRAISVNCLNLSPISKLERERT